MVQDRFTPTIFDKLAGGLKVAGLTGQEETAEAKFSREQFVNFAIPDLRRFNERALRATVKRELSWLLNTTNLASSIDLEDYPQVRSSVLNYGVPDLSGQAMTKTMIRRRAREMRQSILDFEPRLEESTLRVEPLDAVERIHAVTFLISGDVETASQALPVKYKTDVDAEIASVEVRE
ncbi:type VI secretion protein [Novosphingobium sp. PC22D]|uniref:type VI secretion system baseplate subunit TssE n=1 Tax=Novosphingobium sp. PC22D TaxID=1962403 RepID=UPI000BF19A51|nr:type VI secretion system baseplate subunit TssE [Novosphingobium sp. PC22D]PEQ14585.1 type VI secretion protein [Novosphingobium sp. PC22D]